ncbi:MAG: hypothetical protein ABH950_06850 [Candidatus Altiarchaeota archaeon]
MGGIFVDKRHFLVVGVLGIALIVVFYVYVLHPLAVEKRREDALKVGGVPACDVFDEKVEVGTYALPLGSEDEVQRVVKNWIRDTIVSPVDTAKSLLMNNTVESSEDLFDDPDSLYGKYHTYFDPIYVKYASGAPLTAEELKPVDTYMVNIQNNFTIEKVESLTNKGEETYEVHLFFLKSRNQKNVFGVKGILLPRGAIIHTIPCSDEIGRRSLKCFPTELVFSEGKIYKLVRESAC